MQILYVLNIKSEASCSNNYSFLLSSSSRNFISQKMDQRLSLFLRPRNGASMFTPFSKITPVVRRPESPQEITHFEKPIEELAELLTSQGAKAKYLQEKLCDGFFRVRCKIEKLNVIEDAFADTAENAMEKVASSLL